jgi:hypothetical protein
MSQPTFRSLEEWGLSAGSAQPPFARPNEQPGATHEFDSAPLQVRRKQEVNVSELDRGLTVALEAAAGLNRGEDGFVVGGRTQCLMLALFGGSILRNWCSWRPTSRRSGMKATRGRT